MPHWSFSIRMLAVGALLTVCPPDRLTAQSVRPGIDVLLSDSLRLVVGRRVGLITNQAGVDAAGVSTVDRIWALTVDSQHTAALVALFAPQHGLRGTALVSLFSPEHGLRGVAAPGEAVGDSVDIATGLPIYSLYGTNRAPTARQLESLDVLLVDLPDVGARPWTYVTTMVETMRAAAAAGRRVIVLDRPNPIGCGTAGPVLDTAYTSFIGPLPVPLRHGLTIGELARLANGELRIGADLVVVPVDGWRRCQWFDETRLPWVRPSPNLPDLASVAWFPGTVLLEATNLSVGRGSDAPFRQVGAPWLDAAALVARLRRRGVRVDTVTFTPRDPGDGKYPGMLVHGIRFRATSRRDPAEPIRVVQAVFEAVRAQHPDSFQVQSRGLALRLGVEPVSLPDWARTERGWQGRVGRYLLYAR